MPIFFGPYIATPIDGGGTAYTLPVTPCRGIMLSAPTAVVRFGIFDSSQPTPAGYTELGIDGDATPTVAARDAVEAALGLQAEIVSQTVGQVVLELMTRHASHDGSTACYPLDPVRGGQQWRVRLGGKFYTKAVNRQSAEWATLIACWQDDLAYEIETNGLEQAGRKLVMIADRLGVEPAVLIPESHPELVPVMPGTRHTDNFNGGAQLTWQDTYSGFTAQNNRWEVTATQHSPTWATANTVSSADQWAQASVSGGVNDCVGPMVRGAGSGGSTTGMAGYFGFGSVVLRRYSGNSFVDVSSDTAPSSGNCTLKLIGSGSDYELLRNDVSILIGTDSNDSGLFGGIFGYTSGGWADNFLVDDGLPTLTSVSPSTGSRQGGTALTLTGANMDTATAITVGTAAATNVTGVSDTTATCDVAAGLYTAGATVDVAVENAAGVVTLASSYTFWPSATISSVSPDDISAAGGQTVTINGTGYSNGTIDTITIGGAAATSVSVVNDTTITCQTPAISVMSGASDPADLVLVDGNTDQQTSAGIFTVWIVPTISAIDPASGSTAGGTAVEITVGEADNGIEWATVGGVTLSTFSAVGASITGETGPHAAGAVAVAVGNPGATGTSAGAYTYTAAALPAGVTTKLGQFDTFDSWGYP